MEGTPIDNPAPVDIPNEITLAQRVTFFILPAGGHGDVNTVFYWCPEEIVKDGRREYIEIPHNIPIGFVLRVKANTLHDVQDNRMAKCTYGSVPMCFMIDQRANVGQLKAREFDWMVQRNLGSDGTLDNAPNDNEAIDFDLVYPVIAANADPQLTIFLRQRSIEVSSSESWINVSDRMVRESGSLLRIFPVFGDVEDRDHDDGSYSIAWEDGKQYWYDIVCDEAKDRRGLAKEVRMVDPMDRGDTLFVPSDANIQEVMEIWARVLDTPDSIEIRGRSGNGIEFFCAISTAADMVPCTLRTQNFHGDVQIFPGSDVFQADQMGRILNIQFPPVSQGRIVPRVQGGSIFESDGEVQPLNLRLLREHVFIWNIEGRMLEAPLPKSCWPPYDLNEIMRFGHSINSAIPDDANEAEFPPTPWGDRVTIRVKSQASPSPPSSPLPVGDGSLDPPSAPGLPTAWKGPTLGQAPPISADAAELANYHSPYQTVAADQEPEDWELQRLRGISCSDAAIHTLVSWTTRKDYPTFVGISLPIQDWVGQDFHEIQFWEDAIEPIQFSHTAIGVYEWLKTRMTEKNWRPAL
jgi:hypothetical protein